MKFRIPGASLKFAIAFAGVFLFRLIPFRPPNVEPVMATMMPFSKRYGLLTSFAFGFLSIVLYDAATSGWGIWTAVTALSYGLVGIASHFYFRSRSATRLNFVGFGIAGTLFYDAATGLTIGPLFEHQSFALALAGQIPFTILHLIGTVFFALVLSPLVYRFVVENRSLELSFKAHRPKATISV